MSEDERKPIPIGTKVVVRGSGAEGVVVNTATNGKWTNMFWHKVEYRRFGIARHGWFEAYDLLVLEQQP